MPDCSRRHAARGQRNRGGGGRGGGSAAGRRRRRRAGELGDGRRSRSLARGRGRVPATRSHRSRRHALSDRARVARDARAVDRCCVAESCRRDSAHERSAARYGVRKGSSAPQTPARSPSTWRARRWRRPPAPMVYPSSRSARSSIRQQTPYRRQSAPHPSPDSCASAGCFWVSSVRPPTSCRYCGWRQATGPRPPRCGRLRRCLAALLRLPLVRLPLVRLPLAPLLRARARGRREGARHGRHRIRRRCGRARLAARGLAGSCAGARRIGSQQRARAAGRGRRRRSHRSPLARSRRRRLRGTVPRRCGLSAGSARPERAVPSQRRGHAQRAFGRPASGGEENRLHLERSDRRTFLPTARPATSRRRSGSRR